VVARLRARDPLWKEGVKEWAFEGPRVKERGWACDGPRVKGRGMEDRPNRRRLDECMPGVCTRRRCSLYRVTRGRDSKGGTLGSAGRGQDEDSVAFMGRPLPDKCG
jgi:hypothetical protein